MSKFKVQFQKGLSFNQFLQAYGSETQCRQALFEARWPQGFRCPGCGHKSHCELKSRPLIQCNRCHRQTSLTTGTVMSHTKLPLTTWFLAMFLVTQSKNGLSAMELKRHLGVRYPTAWSLQQKLMQAMREADDARPLSGAVQIDDAYIGGERRGGKRGRGAAAKTPFIAAVACSGKCYPLRMRMTPVESFSYKSIRAWSRAHLRSNTHVTSDGLWGFQAMAEVGTHRRILTGSGAVSVETPELAWVNTMLGNVKNALRGTFHSIGKQHVGRYLGAFAWRFNRRNALDQMVNQLAKAVCHAPPLPYRVATVAELHG